MNTIRTITGEAVAKSHAQALSEASYVRERVTPGLRDLNYLHLSDLAELLRREAPGLRGEVFDYGCGGAPYRAMFTQCRRYVAADIEANPSVDILLQPDGSTGQPDQSYDVVLSTQVLEHIQQPESYVRECHRILRPGGQLLLTTHGMFEEHGCPYDFQRWTSRGLEVLALKCGFQIVASHKLTTELRGFVHLTNQMSLHFRCPRRPFLHFLLAAIRKAYGCIGVPALNWFADRCPEQAIVSGQSTASLYTCIAVRAVKP